MTFFTQWTGRGQYEVRAIWRNDIQCKYVVILMCSPEKQIKVAPWGYIDCLVQEIRNSSALAMELRLSCINPSIWFNEVILQPCIGIIYSLYRVRYRYSTIVSEANQSWKQECLRGWKVDTDDIHEKYTANARDLVIYLLDINLIREFGDVTVGHGSWWPFMILRFWCPITLLKSV